MQAIGSEMPGVELKVMDKLKEKHHAITTVESCTGGRIADLLTNVGGAAQVYWGSVITYDGSLKSDWGVPAIPGCIVVSEILWVRLDSVIGPVLLYNSCGCSSSSCMLKQCCAH